MGEATPSRGTHTGNESWRVQLFRACRDGSIELVESLANANPTAIHEHFNKGLEDWQLEWESLEWHELGEATCLYVAASYCQEDLVRWLLANGADRGKSCYLGQKPLDVVGQFRQDDATAAAAEIRLMLTQEVSRPRAPVAPSCSAKLRYPKRIDGVPMNRVAKAGTTKATPKRGGVSTASCEVFVSWPTYWLSDITSSRDGQIGGGVTYELHYRPRASQDWVSVATKTPNKILTGMNTGEWYDFKVRAVNSAGNGDFSSTTAFQMPGQGQPENMEHPA